MQWSSVQAGSANGECSFCEYARQFKVTQAPMRQGESHAEARTREFQPYPFCSGSDMIGWIVVGAETSALESMVAVYDRKHPSSLNAKHGDGLRLDPPAVRETAVAAAPAPPQQQQTPAAEFITLTRAVEVAIAYGKTRLSAGTRLKVVSRTATSINAVYLGETVAIPRDAASK